MPIYATQSFLWRVFTILILCILVLPSAKAADLPLSENYESVGVGYLPATHKIGQGGAHVVEAAQKGGGIGKILVINEGSRVTIDPGVSSDISVSVDINDNSQSGYVGIQMSPDGSSGYILEYNSVPELIILSKISNGFKNTLGFTSASAGNVGWNRIILEARGSHIRGAVLLGGHILSGEIRAYDYEGAYMFGDVVLGKEAGRGPATVLFDNLEIKTAPILIGAASVKLPQTLNFNAADFALRNNLTLHPNIDLMSGGYALGIFKDKNGGESNALAVSSGSYAKIKSESLSNFILKVDLDDSKAGAWIGVRMSPDAQNGYLLFYNSFYKIVDFYQLTKGERLLLGRSFIYRPLSGWYKLSVELDGVDIRASLEDTEGIKLASLSVSDSTYKSGFILLGRDLNNFWQSAKFRNFELLGNSIDSDNDGVVDSHDDCKYRFGLSAYRGCPLAYKTKVYLGVYGLKKEAMLPLAGALVKIFDRSRVDFTLLYGHRIEDENFEQIYEAGIGQINECRTDFSGECALGTVTPGSLLAVAKYAEGHQTAYAGKIINFKSSFAGSNNCRSRRGETCHDDDPTFASSKAKRSLIVKELNFEKTVYPNGSFTLKAGGEKNSALVKSSLTGFLANFLNLFGF